MGLGNLFGRRIDQDIQAYMDVMMILAMADGELEDEEVQDLIVSIYSHPRMKGMSERQIVTTGEKSYQLLLREGVDARLRAASQALPEKVQRIDAMTMALSMSASDGTIEPEEMAVLRKIQTAFNLSDSEIDQIIDSL